MLCPAPEETMRCACREPHNRRAPRTPSPGSCVPAGTCPGSSHGNVYAELCLSRHSWGGAGTISEVPSLTAAGISQPFSSPEVRTSSLLTWLPGLGSRLTSVGSEDAAARRVYARHMKEDNAPFKAFAWVDAACGHFKAFNSTVRDDRKANISRLT